MVILTLTHGGICLIFVFYSTMPYIYLMLYQLVPHVVVEGSSYFPYSLFIVFLRVFYLFLIAYRYIYSPVFLCFTNWSSLYLFLKSLHKLQPKLSLES